MAPDSVNNSNVPLLSEKSSIPEQGKETGGKFPNGSSVKNLTARVGEGLKSLGKKGFDLVRNNLGTAILVAFVVAAIIVAIAVFTIAIAASGLGGALVGCLPFLLPAFAIAGAFLAAGVAAMILSGAGTVAAGKLFTDEQVKATDDNEQIDKKTDDAITNANNSINALEKTAKEENKDENWIDQLRDHALDVRTNIGICYDNSKNIKENQEHRILELNSERKKLKQELQELRTKKNELTPDAQNRELSEDDISGKLMEVESKIQEKDQQLKSIKKNAETITKKLTKIKDSIEEIKVQYKGIKQKNEKLIEGKPEEIAGKASEIVNAAKKAVETLTELKTLVTADSTEQL